MDSVFASMVSSGLCVPIHQPQTHLCNLGSNLSEKRWAAESPPHCLAGPDEISKHTAVQEPIATNSSGPVLLRHEYWLNDHFWLIVLRRCGVVKL